MCQNSIHNITVLFTLTRWNSVSKIIFVYVDDFSDKLVEGKVGCSIDNLYMNHVMYADDICLMAPSPAALQELINICYDFNVRNELSFN